MRCSRPRKASYPIDVVFGQRLVKCKILLLSDTAKNY
jgi:hypothetical protein